ncbi:hypothetical protein GCK72_019704 [Caenorhabditis remanei]|uniref:Uncharacterized protein n=1 Tax=Caenorhabditis remanei TaxID=31234 RepID=A0A6A5GDC0_CAERE|nr:hypothetical protein GCK72_019704 [Caenorhabditis remanei]KAF1753148.1 hypothetical protein GCK72_019704 [Caenorhabditis remanei]
MKTLILLLALTAVSVAQIGLAVPAGTKDFELPIHASDVKAFTRKLKNGETQTWNLSGANKGTWVDSKGKKIPSTNFVFVAPSNLKIKKVTKGDAGFYDYISTFAPVDPAPLPPGVHIDPGMPTGFDLTVN